MQGRVDSNDMSDLIINSSTAPVPLRVVLYIHTANVVWTLFVLFLGAIPYYHYWGAEMSLLGLVVSGPVWFFVYLLMALAHANSRATTTVICGGIWTACSAAVVGFGSAMLFNIAPLQLVAISFAQSIAIVIYAQAAAHHHDASWRWALPGVAMATLAAWLASIYGFMVEDDWLFALALLLLSVLLAAYNARAISRARDYSVSEADVERAIADYYVGDVAAVIKYLQT